MGSRHPLPFELLRFDAWLLWLFVAGLLLIWWLWRDSLRAWPLSLGFAAIAITGYLSASLALSQALYAPLRSFAGLDDIALVGRVATIPKYRAGHTRFMLDVSEVQGYDEPAGGMVYAFIKCDEPPALSVYDQVRLYCSLEEAAPPLNRGQFDYRGYLLQRGTVLTSYSPSPKCLKLVTAGPYWPWAAIAGLRSKLVDNLRQRLPERHADLAVSVVYGDKITDLDEETEEKFRRAGLTHILVASGTQVSLLILLLSLLFWRVTGDYSWQGILRSVSQFVVTLGAILLYASVTGFETSIIRALAMGVLLLLGRLAHREADGLTTLAQSGLILLVVNPLQLFAAGFQLSFLATFGLIYLAGVLLPLAAQFKGWRYYLAGALITTGGAQLFVVPVLAASFHQLSMWGLFSNLIAVPVSLMLLLASAALSVGLGAIPLLGTLLSWVATALAWFLDGWATLFAGLPGSDIAFPAHPLWLSLLFYALVLLACEWFKLRGKLAPRQIALLKFGLPATALVLFASWLWWALVPAPSFTALALPGCEGYIWRPATGRTVLILSSTGLERSHNLDTVLSALRYRGINRLHAVYWLDREPEDDPLAGYKCRGQAAGGPVKREFDMCWLAADGQPAGLLLGLGAEQCCVIPGTSSARDAAVDKWLSDPVKVLLIGNRVSAAALGQLDGHVDNVAVPLRLLHTDQDVKQLTGFTQCWGELNVRVDAGKLRLKLQKSGVPALLTPLPRRAVNRR